MENQQKVYKVRKSGNSSVVTIPNEVKEKLDLQTGDLVSFTIKGDKVFLEKSIKPIDVDKVAEKEIQKYYSLLEELGND